jgi:hypothetical protein
MKVFISFSGERSRLVAEALHKWLRQVVQAARPFLSEYIEKGSQWPTELTSALNACNFGIVCLTPENLHEPWILFEAGALSKAVGERTHVCPYLLGLGKSDVPPPLGLFQLTKADRNDTLNLVKDLNAAIPDEDRLPDGDLRDVFDQSWPKLEAKLKEIGAASAQVEPKRTDRALLEEMLGLLRAQEADRRSQWIVPTGIQSSVAAGASGLRTIDMSDFLIVDPQGRARWMGEIKTAGMPPLKGYETSRPKDDKEAAMRGEQADKDKKDKKP